MDTKRKHKMRRGKGKDSYNLPICILASIYALILRCINNTCLFERVNNILLYII